MAARKSEDDTAVEDGLVTSQTRPSKATPVAPADAEQAESVTGRVNDLQREQPKPALANSSFADRAKARQVSEKRVAEAQNKAVKAADAEQK